MHAMSLVATEQPDETKVHTAPPSSWLIEWQALLDDCSAETRRRYALEMQQEEDRRREAVATRLPVRILQRRLILFILGWYTSCLTIRASNDTLSWFSWFSWFAAAINATCLAAAHRLRASPHGVAAFYPSLIFCMLYTSAFFALPPLWMTFAAGLCVEMCVDIDRCCRRYAWKQECYRLSQLKRIDDPSLKVVDGDGNDSVK